MTKLLHCHIWATSKHLLALSAERAIDTQRLRISEFPNFRISEFPNFRISEFPNSRISEFPNSRIPEFPNLPNSRIYAFPHFLRFCVSECPVFVCRARNFPEYSNLAAVEPPEETRGRLRNMHSYVSVPFAAVMYPQLDVASEFTYRMACLIFTHDGQPFRVRRFSRLS
jgi:hypothetical protein